MGGHFNKLSASKNKIRMKFNIPKEIEAVLSKLEEAGFVAYIVGGSVRDLLMKKPPKDWDVATDAKPEEVQKLFPESVYENRFGTVGVKTGSDNPALSVVEVTTFRREESYSDLRHPDTIEFTDSIEEDLARRDFTINAIALSSGGDVTDPFGGADDIKKKIVRAVGDPSKRFLEDALRLIRAVRFGAELGFRIEENTEKAIYKNAKLLSKVANERVRDEFVRIIMSKNAKLGIEKLEELGLLEHILPELREGIGITQNKHHKYTVWEHNILSLEYAAKKGYSLEVRLAALLHDVGKPRVKEGEGPDATFYNHEIVSAKMAKEALRRLCFPRAVIEKVAHLTRYHMFYYNVGEVTEAGVRRFLRRVGLENVPDLIKLREADRIGSGVPKAVPYKLRHFLFMIEKVRRDPITTSMLKVSGDDVMKLLGITPSPRVGWVLAILLDEVIDDPKRNTKKHLTERVMELGKLSDGELEALARKARERKEEFESGIEAEMKKKYYVK